MANHLNIVFLWHFHQPDYVHPERGRAALPWVRLHALCGYSDMVAALEQNPEARVTLNLTPVLLLQLERLVAGDDDEWLLLCRKKVPDLDTGEREFLADHLFSAQPQHMIAPLDRYQELHQRRNGLSLEEFAARCEDRDLLDLQVLFHLAWSGWDLRRNQQIQALLEQQRDYTELQKEQLFLLQAAHWERLLPRIRDCAKRGSVELSSTPFAHPILPLLCDFPAEEFAAEGEADVQFSWPQDAEQQVKRAMEVHRRVLGTSPAGMWPAEGAVSQQAAEVFARHGLRWIASDEEILFQSLPDGESREELYRSHELIGAGPPIHMLFRDHGISDLLGFTYQTWKAEDAVADLLHRLDQIRQDCSLEEPIVSIILDGENPWEHYPGGGEVFLGKMYAALQEHSHLHLRTISEALDLGQGERGRLSQLASGSWIDGSFATWAGHREKRNAWRMLAELRGAAPASLEEMPAELADSILALEGSDWFWWLGDDHLAEHREEFDALFLAHVQRAQRSIGRELIAGPLRSERSAEASIERPPSGLIGDEDVGEFLQSERAGLVTIPPLGSAMTRASRDWHELRFAFSDSKLFVLLLGRGGVGAATLVDLRDHSEHLPRHRWQHDGRSLLLFEVDPANGGSAEGGSIRLQFSLGIGSAPIRWPSGDAALCLSRHSG